jgi:hypothetical protein
MKILVALGIAVAIFSPPAFACSYSWPTPKETLRGDENAVLAYPIGVSNLPQAGSDPMFRGKFRQTVLWRVLISWHGKYQPGDQFTTRGQIDRSGMCLERAVYDSKPSVLTFSGKEPYASYGAYTVEDSPEIFQYLQKAYVKGGT